MHCETARVFAVTSTAERLRDLIEREVARGRKKKHIYAQANIDSGRVSKLLRGEGDIGPEVAARLAPALKTTPAHLMGLEPAPPHTLSEPRVTPVDENEESVVLSYRGLDRATSTALLAVLGAAGTSKGIRSALRGLAEVAREGGLVPVVGRARKARFEKSGRCS